MQQLKREDEDASLHAHHVNPQWARLLDVLGLNVRYASARGAELVTTDGHRILDFDSGRCVHNAGHNHPRIVRAVRAQLDLDAPVMLHGHAPELAGELAARLCARAGGRAGKVLFTSSGSEGVEAAIKFARARTRRAGILAASGAFHGLTCGALSLMDGPFWREGFGPLLEDARSVPFGDLDALAAELGTRRHAAFIVEPVQVEAGVCVAPAGYLQTAETLCRETGTLFVVDEVQTGLHRTGPFLASHHFGLDPDMIVLAQALSGGLVPVGALLMSDAIYDAVYSSFKRAAVHSSSFGENALAMRAGLATMDVLEEEELGPRAARLGDWLRGELRARLARFPTVRGVHGLGMLSAIKFGPPRSLRMRMPFEAFSRVHPAMFGQVLVMHLFHDGGIFGQMCANQHMSLKVAPPLVASEAQLGAFVDAVEGVVVEMHASRYFWNQALGMARRLLHVV
jgi:ornithine--oxo-acid transaminase